MSGDNITQIILAVIGLVGALISGILIPYIRNKTTKEQREAIRYWTEIAVTAIEKMYEGQSGMGLIKKDFVIDFIKKQGYKITEEQLSLLIDAVVEELINKPKGQLTGD